MRRRGKNAGPVLANKCPGFVLPIAGILRPDQPDDHGPLRQVARHLGPVQRHAPQQRIRGVRSPLYIM